MKAKVNPTRQELLELKNRLKRARTGHKLLEDKLESLMQEFLGKIKQIGELREQVRRQIPKIYLSFMKAKNILGPNQTEEIVSSVPELQVLPKQENIVGVKTSYCEPQNKDQVLDIRFSNFPPNFFIKETHQLLEDIFEDLIKYARLEQEIRSLADEITTTRRRVNALEHVFIPQMEETQDYIAQKLEENERFERALLMKLKDQIA